MSPKPELKLGLQPFVEDKRDLLFAKYLRAELPALPPLPFGHGKLISSTRWGMLGNDRVGDCAWAGSAHETMLLCLLGGRNAQFDDHAVLSDYASTGFNPRTGAGDNGTDMRRLMQYRQKKGIIDTMGYRHKIGAYTWLEPGNITELQHAVHLFNVAPIGFQVPRVAMDQFHQGKPWDVVEEDGGIEGGHYVCATDFDKAGNIIVITWGRTQPMTQAFFQKYCTSAVGILSNEQLRNGKSPEGFDLAALQADLKAI